MKKQYWFIVLFAFWCLGCALWYLFGVKGVSTDLNYFDPQPRLIAIIEILAMLLIACLLGYAIAWWQRGENIEIQNEKTEDLADNINLLNAERDELKSQVERWREKHRHDLLASQQKTSALVSESEKLQKQIETLELSMASTKSEGSDTTPQLRQAETEMGTLRYRIRQLEFQSKENEEVNIILKQELEAARSAKKTKSTDPLFSKPVGIHKKDDLTKIKGIGPFIEKRLNMIGIYTFRQLSELTPDHAERVGAAIEYFPARITNENWIGQAASFLK